MSLAGKAIVAIWHDILPEGRDEFYWWHIHEHMPERVDVPKFLRGRRYIAEQGAPEFFNFYEAQSIEVLGGADYLDRLNDPSEWTTKTVKHFVNVSRSLQEVRYSSGPGMGGWIQTYAFDTDLDKVSAGELARQLTELVLKPLSAEMGICGVHLSETDLEISGTPTAEKEKRGGGTDMPGWSLLIEAARKEDLDRVLGALASEDRLRQLGAGELIRSGLYRLEYTRTNTDDPV